MTRVRLLLVAVAAALQLPAVVLAADRGGERGDCRQGWAKLPAARKRECARLEAKVAPDALSSVAGIKDDDQRLRATAALCAELGSCAGECAPELQIVTMADWSSWPRPKDAPARSTSCAEFREVDASASPAQARERAGAWARRRVGAFARQACAFLDDGGRARLSCASVGLGVTPMPGACGNAAPACGRGADAK